MNKNQLGGQADFNSITIYDNKKHVTVLRNNDGSLLIKVKIQSKDRLYLLKRIFLIRGFVQFINTMFTQLNSHSIQDINPTKKQLSSKIKRSLKFIYDSSAIITFFLIFIFIPTFIQFIPWFENQKHLFILFEGATRIMIYLLLLELVSKLNNITYLLKYHAAEHMAINAYAKNKQLTVPAIRRGFQKNIRCGSTYFYILAIIYAIFFVLIYFIDSSLSYNIFLRLAALPICSGITHEVINIIDRYKENINKKILSFFMIMQKKTLRYPDDHHLQVAITAIHIHQLKTIEKHYILNNFSELKKIK